MKLYNSLPDSSTFKNAVLTQGTFDGVHVGHKKIIDKLKSIAKEVKGETVLLTFYPHPRHVLNTHSNELKLLSTIEEKIQLLEEAGLDNLVVIPFNPEFAALEPEEFVKNILLEKFDLHTLVVGYDHRFGKNRKGDYELLRKLQKEMGFELHQIGVHEIEEITISSTFIRKSIMNGDIETANKLLGRPYLMRATVVEGQKIGRTIGFPTANLMIEDAYKQIPASGVYAVNIKLDNNVHGGMLNIGTNPTVLSKGFSIEVNIFNFASDIYGKPLEISFIARLRDEIRFNNLVELRIQLTKDKINAEEKLQISP